MLLDNRRTIWDNARRTVTLEFKKRGTFPGYPGKIIGRCGAFVLGLFAITTMVKAQEVIAPGPDFSTPPVPPPAQQPSDESATAQTGLEAASAVSEGPVQPFRWGPLTLRPHPSYRFIYGDGVQASPGRQLTTAIHEIAPGFLIEAGPHWYVDYSPALKYYSNPAFRDTVDHSVRFAGAFAYDDWTLNLSQRYSKSTSALVETASQTEQENFSTALAANYQFNSKWGIEMSANQVVNNAQNFTSSKNWSTLEWLNYEILPNLSAAVGAGGGYADVDIGSDSAFEQIQTRIKWRTSLKTALTVHAGFESRQFVVAGGSSMTTPIYGATLDYTPTATTKLSLVVDRTVTTSLLFNQVTETTAFSADVSQRFLGFLTLSLSGSYRNTSYTASTSTLSIGREDDYYSINTRLSCPFLKRGTLAVFYNHSENTSSARTFAFTSSQFGVELGYRY